MPRVSVLLKYKCRQSRYLVYLSNRGVFSLNTGQGGDTQNIPDHVPVAAGASRVPERFETPSLDSDGHPSGSRASWGLAVPPRALCPRRLPAPDREPSRTHHASAARGPCRGASRTARPHPGVPARVRVDGSEAWGVPQA